MALINTPIAEQVKIVLFGIRNAGKSSLMNNLFEREVTIVSENPGTTTDPVTKSLELGNMGPVALTDTAGFDDTGELGLERIRRSVESLSVADIHLLVTRADTAPTAEEKEFAVTLNKSHKHLIAALTFTDKKSDAEKSEWIRGIKHVSVDNLRKTGIDSLKKLILSLSDKIDYEMTPVEGLVRENGFVILVTPIDLAAPKGRLILPQVETIRDLLDRDCGVMIVKERELKFFYDALKFKPDLVICDSQVFSKVSADISESQKLTSFSILFARKKGDLACYIDGVKALNSVPEKASILILESCSHHRQADDIGTVKIPRLFRQLVRSSAEFVFSRELPAEPELKKFFMVINCAGCMASRNKIIQRLDILKKHSVHVTNYGLFLAWANGLLPRALEPFEYEYSLYSE
ncbi:MAG: [FeFe] hydrogenase H-cluster maturation GTPase HydF [Spirochaetes bacterium]|nr:[FeFe] hydrogenase H-cluster maturation GTPase HydF [Spirochaetota bacterium]